MGYFSSKTNLETGTLSRKSSSASIKSEVKFNLDILDDLLSDVETQNKSEKENQVLPNIEKKDLGNHLKENEGTDKLSEIDETKCQPLNDVNKSLKKKHVGFYTVFHGWLNRNKTEDTEPENKVFEKEKLSNLLDSKNISENSESLNVELTKQTKSEKTSTELVENKKKHDIKIGKEQKTENKIYEKQNQNFDISAKNIEIENKIPDYISDDKQTKGFKITTENNKHEKSPELAEENIDRLFNKDIYKDYFKSKDNTCDPISRLLIFDKMNVDTMSSFNMQLDSLKLNIGNDYRLLNKWGVYLYNRQEKSFKRIFIKIENHEKLERLISMFAKYKKGSSLDKKSYMLSIEGEKPKNNSQEEMYCIFNIKRKHGYTAIKTILRLILDDSIHLEKQYNIDHYNDFENSKAAANNSDQESIENLYTQNKQKMFLIIFAIQLDLHEENCIIKFYIKRKGFPKDIPNGIIKTFLRETMSNRLPEKIRYIIDDAKTL